MADPFLVATTEAIAGWTVVRTVGYVEGEYEPYNARLRAMRSLRAEARRLGANAIVGLRWCEGAGARGEEGPPMVYGTAVVIEPAGG